MIPFLELKSQFQSIEREIRQAIDQVFASSSYILGKQLEAFEEEFAAYITVPNAVGVGSGTDAIHLALRAIGIGPEDEVITAANTCVPTLAGIAATGATPVLADIDAATFTLDPARVEAAVTEKTKAVVPVHLYGHPCDMDAILAITQPKGIAVVEDCAQAHGSSYRGRSCGSFGRAAAFSFYPSKNLGAYGDGGAVTTNDEAVAENVRRLRNYGETERYRHAGKGFNSRLDELQAAVLRVKLRHLDEWNDARRHHALGYREALEQSPLTLPTEAPWAKHCHHLYVVRSPHRDALRAHLADHEIGTQLHYPIPIHLQEAYAFLGKAPGDYPVAEEACHEVLSLPIYPELPPDAAERVAQAIRSFAP